MARVDKKVSTTLLIRLKKSGGASAHPTQFGRNPNTRLSPSISLLLMHLDGL